LNMHLSDEELKSLWQAETTPQTRTACLSSEQLVRAGEGKLAANEMAQVISHIEQCAACAEEYRLVAAVKDWATEAAPKHAEVFAPPPITTQMQEHWWQRFAFFNWQVPAFALAGLALLALGWFAWRALGNRNVEEQIAVASPTPTPSASPVVTPSATPEATLVAQLQDGAQLIALNQQGELSGADHLSPAHQQMVKEALTSQRLERAPALAGLQSAGNVLRGGDEHGNSFALTEPIGKVIRSARPVFRWSSLAGASGYVVEIYDDQFNLVVASPSLTTTSWTVSQSLVRDKIYSWQVKASKDGQEFKAPKPNAPQATFRVLSQAKTNELTQAERRASSSPLTLGLLYVEAGLLDEAEAEFRKLQRANPNSPIARRLLTNVRALRR
jgi:hypothetical protein